MLTMSRVWRTTGIVST